MYTVHFTVYNILFFSGPLKYNKEKCTVYTVHFSLFSVQIFSLDLVGL